MRTSVFLLIAVVGGYFVYHLWFSPEEATPEDYEFVGGEENPSADAEAAADQAADADGSSEANRRRDKRTSIIIGGSRGGTRGSNSARPNAIPLDDDPREAEAWELMDRLKDARNASDQAEATKLVDRIWNEYEHTDVGRLLSFEKGNEAINRFRALGRTPQGYQAAQEARKYLTPALFLGDDVVDKGQREALRKRLRQMADEMLFTGRHIDGVDQLYRTKRGDTLDVLCRKVFPQKWGIRAAPGLVMAVNRIRRPQDLRADVNIRVPIGTPKLIVAKHEFRLYFLLDGAYVRDWPVGLGAEASQTPLGTFKIRSKLVNPDWFPRQGVKIPFGNPRNILGNRWMGFADTAEFTGFGIHGTTKPQSIGKRESSGCVRMGRNDVEELFSWTPRGAEVEIRR